MSDLISVIIPIYNVEPYLSDCIESIIKQTYTNLEIILVDDGSPDKCGDICDMYAEKDSRITVIHKKNGGLSDARNAGLDIATGKYVTFIDSDDAVALDMVEYLYEMLCESNADITVCQPEIFSDDIPEIKWQDRRIETITGSEKCLEYYFKTRYVQSVAWGKLYKKDMFEYVRYPFGKMHEDEFTTYRLISLANRISVGFSKKYFYRIRSGSIMREIFSMRNLDGIEAAIEIKKYIDTNFPKLSLYAQCGMVAAANTFSIKLIASESPIEEYYEVILKIQKIYRQYEKFFLRGPNSLKAKAFSAFAFLNLKMWIRICRKMRFFSNNSNPQKQRKT